MITTSSDLHAILYTMEQDIANSQPKSKHTLPQLQKLIRDSRVAQLLRTQISLLPQSVFSVRLAYNHLFVIINLTQYKKLEALQNKSSRVEPKATDIDSTYALKISKSFPLKESVRLLMLDGGFQPKISDSRDLMEEVMGKPYHYSMPFIQILNSLLIFDVGLHNKNELFLEMQKIGKFSLGEKFFYHEVSQLYCSLNLLKDVSKKSSTYIGVSQTHILTFKQLQTQQKQSPSKLKHPKTMAASNLKEVAQSEEETLNELMLVGSAELQCIESIHYKQNEKLVKIACRKYKSIKLYHEFEEIKRQYKLLHPQILLRAVLKHITKFQHCSIHFQPYREPTKKDKKPTISESMVTHRENERINFYIDECSRLEQLLLKKQSSEEERKKGVQNLNRFYQKLIQYYSTRANPYYLIYVNKLNLLCSQFYHPPPNKH